LTIAGQGRGRRIRQITTAFVTRNGYNRYK
jgi:hypothetical protein